MRRPSGEILPWNARGSGHGLLRAASGGYRPEARGGAWRRGGASRGEEDALAVRRPALHLIGDRMPGETGRFAAFSGDHIDVDVAAVFATEGDAAAVGRELRVGGLSLEARQPARGTARAFDHPDVVGVGEGHMRGADGGRAQHPRGVRLGAQRARAGERRQRSDGQAEQQAGRATGVRHRESLWGESAGMLARALIVSRSSNP